MSSLGSDPPPGDCVTRGFAVPERLLGELDRWRNNDSCTRERLEDDLSLRLFRTALERMQRSTRAARRTISSPTSP